jgi:transcriptional regulator with XRE-family HTH domain
MNEKDFVLNLIKQFIERRHELGLTQTSVNEDIGVATGLVAKWEIGNRKPTLFNAYCWAEALKCEVKLEFKDDSLRDRSGS